jgi:hypothetical protein
MPAPRSLGLVILGLLGGCGEPDCALDSQPPVQDSGDPVERDGDGDGYDGIEHGGDDCDDDDPAINPGAYDEPWDGVDADCGGGSDDDYDGDGFDADHVGGDDCDDLDPAVHPEASERWYDGVDQDCDGASDFDADGDGWDSQEHASGGDCDDGDPAVGPGVDEIWYDGVDQDCDGGSDYDADGDGYDLQHFGGEDCVDSDASIHPGAFEWHDGEDNDCDGFEDHERIGSGHWALLGEGPGDQAGQALSAAGDVNGDGLPDLLVGAPAWPDGGGEGSVYLLLGGSGARLASEASLWYADARISGAEPGAALGAAVASLGDPSGDGLDDVVLGAPGQLDGGAVFLFDGPLTGDIDLGQRRAVVLGEPGQELGAAVAGGGELDGALPEDVVVGLPGDSSSRGAVLVFTGGSSGEHGPSSASYRLDGVVEGDRVGASVAVLGDVDGDGQDELLVGAPGDGQRGADAGLAYLLKGPLPAGSVSVVNADSTLLAEEAGDRAGFAVAAAGDSDGDGYRDLLVGAPGSDGMAAEGGGAYLLLGPVSAGEVELASARAVFYGNLAGVEAGSAVAGGGDVDGDGLDDFLVGAPSTDLAATDNGAAYLMLGPVAGSLCACGADAVFYGDGDHQRVGSSVALPGDVDGDGFGELVLGAPGLASESGEVDLFLGDAR